MLSTYERLSRWAIPCGRDRLGEVGKLAIFFAFYALYAWRTFHKQVCEDGRESRTYPCPPSPLRLRLWHQVRHPGDILTAVFLQPRDPADRHDGLSCATFLLGGLLSIALGPHTADARRTCNWRLVWLLSCVLLPKGFLIRYGLARPAASLGAAVNTMLPRHTAIMVWLSLAFPVSWRRQALLAAVYVTHMLAVIRLAATRTALTWPYADTTYTPLAMSVRLVVLSALSVAVAAAWDWRRARLERVGRTSGGKTVGGEADEKGNCAADGAVGSAGEGEGPATGGRTGLEEAARRLGSLRKRRATAAVTFGVAAADGGRQSAKLAAAAVPMGGLILDGGCKSGAAGPRPLDTISEAASPPELPSPQLTSPPQRQQQVLQQQVLPDPVVGAAGSAARTPSAALPSRSRDTGHHGLPSSARYRSVLRVSRMHIKMGGVEPKDLNPDVVAVLANDLATMGILLMDVAIRSGCLEVVLEVQHLGSAGAAAGGQPASQRADVALIRRVVSLLAASTAGGAAAAAAATTPVRAHMGSISYSLTYAGGTASCGGAAGADAWRVSVDRAGEDAAGSPADTAVGTAGAPGGSGAACPPSAELPAADSAAELLQTRDPAAAAVPILAAVLPPSVTLPPAVPAPGAAAAVVAAYGAAAAGRLLGDVLEVTLLLRLSAETDVAGGCSAVAAEALPEVLAWQRGCFLKVAGVEAQAPPPGAPSSGVRSYSIRLDAHDAAAGLVTLAIRGVRSGGDGDDGGSGGGDGGSALAAVAGAAGDEAASPRLPPLVYAGCVLLLPPSLAAVGDELGAQLTEEVMAALEYGDADGAKSVAGFLTDLAAWLTSCDETQFVSQPGGRPLAAAATGTVAAAPPVPPAESSSGISSPSCTAVWQPIDQHFGASCSGWTGHEISRSFALTAAFSGSCDEKQDGNDSEPSELAAQPGDIPACWVHLPYTYDTYGGNAGRGHGFGGCDGEGGASGGIWMSSSGGGVGGGGGSSRGCSGGGGVEVPAGRWWWCLQGAADGGAATAGRGRCSCASSALGSEAPAPAAAAAVALAAAAECPGGGGRAAVLRDGGRLDLRDAVADALRCAQRTASATFAGRRARDELHWALLEHVVQCGWPATSRLLFGLLDRDIAEGGWWHRPGGFECLQLDERAADVAAGTSLLHWAVGSAVPTVVDAVMAAAEKYGARGHPCGVYGTWMSRACLTAPPHAAGGRADAADAGAMMTPLDVAAALPDGGAMLSYILRRYPHAASAQG